VCGMNPFNITILNHLVNKHFDDDDGCYGNSLELIWQHFVARCGLFIQILS